MSDLQYRIDTRRETRSADRADRLLKAIAEIQRQYFRASATPAWLESALRAFLDITSSQSGFISEVQRKADGSRILKTNAIINSNQDGSPQSSGQSSTGLELTEPQAADCSQETLRTGELWIDNQFGKNLTLGEVSENQSDIRTVMTVPLKLDDQFIGIVGIVNQKDEYNTALADSLEPLCVTCASLMVTSKTGTADESADTPAIDRQSELESVLNAVNARVLYLDADGRIVRHQLPSQRLTSFLHDNDTSGPTSVFDYHPAESHEAIRDTLRRVFGSGKPATYEAAGRGPETERRVYVCHIVPAFDTSDSPAAMLIATDVTDERAARNAEARHLTLLQAVTEGTTELIFAKDLESRPVFINHAVARLYGRTLDETIANPAEGFFSQEVQKQFIDDDRRIIQTGQSETIEQTLPFPSGDRTFLTTKCPWKNTDGEIIGVIGVSRDITEWRETKDALQDSREHLKAIIDSTPECIKLLARDGTLMEMNPAGLQMVEADSAECVIGRTGFDLVAPECRNAFIEFHNRVCSGTPGSIQYEIIGLKGTRRWMETHAAPLSLGADGETVDLAITRDITVTREAEQTIAEKQAQLIHVSRLSSMGQMAAVISHEVTQPLAAISNFASTCRLIAEQPSPDFQKLTGYLNVIAEQSTRAGAILNRVRGFVRRSDDHRAVCNLSQLIEDSLTLVQSELRSRYVSVKTIFPNEAACVLVDSVQIQQVIVNLVSNACDAMASQPLPRRTIEISVSCSDNQATVEILDNGPGLDEEIQARVFAPFFTTKTDGLGMGLSICSDIIDSHSGSITAENVPNHGAMIRFSLPRLENPPHE